ncbi:small acid-soluble spore protein SspI [Gracilibacillus halophilus YIM-C55.5]|uniref:Small, acid-soluble spore protein I n=1 Tax=Gracilibacillus halophilus YIM-C55.5 TaxID=1308866 RepID=N4W9U2_9BACI|nr:small acid-soluble spore protein SspI [Gracilibacillus halophilus]ENH97043.1 small acid-soluble spore protein SspI [Gracilibacillus halophilus YIM-C55.5]
MDINLRQAIHSNVSGNSAKELEETIIDAIESGEEKMLPGLGVLFEMYWKEANEQDKQEVLSQLEKAVQ